jgi:hypothetical protein
MADIKDLVMIDVNEKVVCVSYDMLLEALIQQSFKIYGMNMPELLEVRKQYLLRRGSLPITIEKIKKTFSLNKD